MATNWNRTFLIASFLAAHPFLSAATIINGGTLLNQTWTLANSPYIILGDVTVPAGQTLTIEAGVEVQCTSADSQGSGRDTARVELIINGTLNVQGTALFPVRFKSQTTVVGSWYGIIITSPATAVTLSDTVIQHAINGLSCEATGTAVQANNLTASSNQTAIVINAGTPALNQLQAFANQTAIKTSSGGGASVVGSVIYGNSLQGIEVNSTASSSAQIVNCTIHSNGTYGVYVGSTSSAVVTIKNTLITGHTYGVYRSVSSSGSIAAAYSDVWGNSFDFFNATAGMGMISAEPIYVDADGADNVFGNVDDNLRLQPNSPCGFSGEGGVDIGAYVIPKLSIYQLQFIGDDARIRILSISNRIHQLQFTEDFSSWMPVGSGVLGTGAILDRTNFGVRILPKRFYRVRLDN